MNYYNDNNRESAAWLRELIVAKLIPHGEVDDRSILEVMPNDLHGYAQCHFFAGIGGWSRALQIAGWPANRSVWTGSCPCQPFSVAGQRKGVKDERHLWPEFHRLIRECHPPTVFGEQVEGAVRLEWVDGVQGDLEAENYAFGFAVLGAHSVGAPHIRQRIYWVADSNGTGSQRRVGVPERADQWPIGKGGVVDFWADSLWYPCRDGKLRRIPAQPKIFDVADGVSTGVDGSGAEGTPDTERFPLAGKEEGRAMILRGAGNAIVPQIAAEFVKAFMGDRSL